MFFERHAEELVEHFVPEKSDPTEVSILAIILHSVYVYCSIHVA